MHKIIFSAINERGILSKIFILKWKWRQFPEGRACANVGTHAYSYVYFGDSFR